MLERDRATYAKVEWQIGSKMQRKEGSVHLQCVRCGVFGGLPNSWP